MMDERCGTNAPTEVLGLLDHTEAHLLREFLDVVSLLVIFSIPIQFTLYQ